MKTLEDTTQLGGFNKRIPMIQYNKRLPYSGTHWHKADNIDTLFSSVKYHGGTTDVELVVGTKRLLMDFYAIGYNSGLNIAKFIQDCFCERGIPINTWSDNAQEDLMWSVRKLLCAYGVVSNKYESHKQNQNPAERRIQDIKGTSLTALDCSETPIWSYILCMAYVVLILKCMSRRSLSWHTPH